MESISSVIVTAVLNGAAAGTTDMAKKAIVDAYESVKKAIASKFGKDSHVSKAIVDLEASPQSKNKQIALAEEAAIAKVNQDSEIFELAHILAEALRATTEGLTAEAKFKVNAKGGKVGVIGDSAHIEGGIHFGDD